MNKFEEQCRLDYYAYIQGKFNVAELLFLIVNNLKDYDFYDKKIKTLITIIKDALHQAKWRDDYPYDMQSLQDYFSFLDEFDDSSNLLKKRPKVVVDGHDSVGVNYRPIDVAAKMYKHWNRLYSNPCLYTTISHLLEASDDLLAPVKFDERIRSFIITASKLYDKALGLTQAESLDECAYKWAYNLLMAHSLSHKSRGSAANGGAATMSDEAFNKC